MIGARGALTVIERFERASRALPNQRSLLAARVLFSEHRLSCRGASSTCWTERQ